MLNEISQAQTEEKLQSVTHVSNLKEFKKTVKWWLPRAGNGGATRGDVF